MKKRINTLAIMILFLVSGMAWSQESAGLTDVILGSWKGNGILFGQDAHFSMTWATDLNGKFLTLTFQNGFTDKSGTERIMNARAYYQLGQGKGYWFDSRGVMQPLTFEVEGSSLIVNWGEASNETGKTIYTVINHEEMSVQDFVYNNESEYQFGEARYKRNTQ